MGRSKDIATSAKGDADYVNVSGDTMSGDLTIDTNTFHVDVADNRVGIGTTTPVHDLQIHKATASSQARIQMTTNESGATNGDGYAVAMEAGNRVYHWLYENAPMQFATNNTLNMVINAGGEITKPNNPCAVWGGSGNISLVQDSSWRDVALNSTVYDKANNYSTSTYRFTAPVAGVYLVGFSGEFHSTSATVWSYLVPRINGSNTANVSSKGNYMADFATSGTYTVHSQTWFLNLAANDYFVFSHIGSGGNITLRGTSEAQFFATLLG
jgi:hypothetical protein